MLGARGNKTTRINKPIFFNTNLTTHTNTQIYLNLILQHSILGARISQYHLDAFIIRNYRNINNWKVFVLLHSTLLN